MPLLIPQAGFVQLGYNRGGIGVPVKATPDGEIAVGEHTILFSAEFNGPSAAALLTNQFNLSATTMTALTNAGFLRFNAGAITTINTGYSIQSWNVFQIQDGASTKARMTMKHQNGAINNKQFDFGFGYHDINTAQSAAMNEFAGFRWTQAGNLVGVLEYSNGGAPTSLTVNINGGVPYSDNVTRTYEVVINESAVEFWVDGEFQARILMQADAPGVHKASGYPIVIREFIGASAAALAPVFDVGSVTVSRRGPGTQLSRPALQAMSGRHILTPQHGIQSANGSLSVVPASGTAPGGVTATNALPALASALSGYYKMNGAAITATVHTEYLVLGYGNPAIPEAAGALNNGRAFFITELMISPIVVGAALTGGGFVLEWFLALGSTAVSLATGDAVGTTALGQKSPKRMPLPIVDSIAAAAAVGTVATRSGEGGLLTFETPLCVNPGEFFQLGFRTLQVTALVSAGSLDGGIGVNGYWQ